MLEKNTCYLNRRNSQQAAMKAVAKHGVRVTLRQRGDLEMKAVAKYFFHAHLLV